MKWKTRNRWSSWIRCLLNGQRLLQEQRQQRNAHCTLRAIARSPSFFCAFLLFFCRFANNTSLQQQKVKVNQHRILMRNDALMPRIGSKFQIFSAVFQIAKFLVLTVRFTHFPENCFSITFHSQAQIERSNAIQTDFWFYGISALDFTIRNRIFLFQIFTVNEG